MGSCNIGPVFLTLWNINDQTVGHVMIVPKNPASGVLLGHAVTAWNHLLSELILHHKNARNAVTDTNAYLLTLPGVTEQWQAVGDGNVKIN
jgi:diadenosine tetraphosphate (Ap4A) HIT family hydrolase